MRERFRRPVVSYYQHIGWAGRAAYGQFGEQYATAPQRQRGLLVTMAAKALTHPDLRDPSVLSRIAERLQRAMGAEQVIVYGSVARGEATIHSDIDLLVIAPSVAEGYRRGARARESIRDLSRGLPISPLVLTPVEVRQRLVAGDPFVRDVLDSGVELLSPVAHAVDRLRAGGPDCGGAGTEPDEQAPESWRRIARQDWQRLYLLLRAGDSAGAGIFLQQALEKFLKGYLVQHGWQLRKTHELDVLLDAASAYYQPLSAFRPLCERVSAYYLVDRYPGTTEEGPDADQLRQELDEARRLVLALFPDEHLEAPA
jgi:HEPN domain-containing protein/predicted nucleotidyltransferase